VAEGVGQSGFKCSLAIKASKDAEAYSLGILLDDDRHYSNENLLEQYYQRPAVLKSFGWRTVQVFTKDWLHQPHKVIESIRRKLVEEMDNGREVPSFEWKTETATAAPGAVPAGGSVIAANGLYDTLSFQRVQFSESGSSKFWEAAVDGQKLVIRFGRIGTRGQTQVKTFATTEEAKAERARLLEEKKAKGYRE
jgi:predicted DNA-binding WGR domain protein